MGRLLVEFIEVYVLHNATVLQANVNCQVLQVQA